MRHIDWSKLQAVYDMARHAGVSFSLNYSEPEDAWYCDVDSAAPAERWQGRTRGFDFAVEDVTDWLRKLASACKP